MPPHVWLPGSRAERLPGAMGEEEDLGRPQEGGGLAAGSLLWEELGEEHFQQREQ